MHKLIDLKYNDLIILQYYIMRYDSTLDKLDQISKENPGLIDGIYFEDDSSGICVRLTAETIEDTKPVFQALTRVGFNQGEPRVYGQGIMRFTQWKFIIAHFDKHKDEETLKVSFTAYLEEAEELIPGVKQELNALTIQPKESN